MRVSGTLATAGTLGSWLLVRTGEEATITVSRTGVGAFAWRIIESPSAGTVLVPYASYTAAGTDVVYKNLTPRDQYVTVSLDVIAPAESLDYAVAPVTGEVILEEWRVGGQVVAQLTDAGYSVAPNGIAPSSWVWVDSPNDFPAAVDGVRTLGDNVTYVITGTVDLLGDRLVAGQNTTLLGGSSENCRIKSTGLTGTALLSSEWSLPMRGLTIEADVALDLDADGNSNQALDWFGVNFTDCPTVGTIANYGNFIATDCAWLNSQGMTYDGSIGTIGFNQCIFDNRASGTSIILPATLTITRRFRATYSAFVSLSGETALNTNASATIPVEGYILDTCNFAGGGTYLSGVQSTDNKALFVNNRGIKNSAEVGFMTMVGNATATTIGSPGVAVKAAGTTTLEAQSQKFSHSNNRLTYTGAITRDFRVIATATCSSSASNQIGLYIAKNGSILANSEQYITANAGGRAEGGSVQCIIELATDQYVEFWVENATGANNITVSELSVIAEAIN